MKRKRLINTTFITLYILFLIGSMYFRFEPGKEIGANFISFGYDMLKIIPCAFILIGLFEVWVRKETVEKHLGEKNKFSGYLVVIFLAGTTVGGLFVAFPVAYTLYNKGAKLSIIFTYIGAAGICRIPMIIFESSFLGLKFTLIRLLISVPLVIITSVILGNYLKKKNYKIQNNKSNAILID